MRISDMRRNLEGAGRRARRTLTSRPFRRQVPEVLQFEATECGIACLAMVLRFYGCHVTVSELREHCGAARDGVTALALVRTAQQYGLRARGLAMKPQDLGMVTLPAVVHWQFGHFLVVERWSPKGVDVVDPAQGRMRMSADEFSDGFTGVVIVLEPGVQFHSKWPVRQLSLGRYAALVLTMRGLLAQVLLASLLLQVVGLGVPLLTKSLIDQVMPVGSTNVLGLLGVGISVLFGAQLLLSLIRSAVLGHLQARVDSQMMLGFFEHLLSLPYRFFQQRATGELVARVNSNAAIRDLLTGQLLSGVLDGGLVMLSLAVLWWQSPAFAGFTLAIGALQVVLVLAPNSRLRALMQRDLAAQGKAQASMTEALIGIATLKAAGREERAFEQWSDLYYDQLNTSVRRNYLSAVVDNSLSLLRTFAPLVLLWLGTQQVMAGSMTVGTMIALNSLAVLCLAPLTSLVAGAQRMQLLSAHFERVSDVLDAAPETMPREPRAAAPLRGAIDLQNVTFRYDAAAAPVLRNVSLRIAPGQKVAFVGPSGSGKSTLLKLLVGLYEPTEGEIRYDGRPMREHDLRNLRRQFGVVMQDAFIFSGTIRSNIAFNHPDIPLDQVVQAATRAALHDDIAAMPMGYETYVAEGGSAFSGGQRQRLAIARALAHSPSVLLLDEATSHLDSPSEQVVEGHLALQHCTRIVIAHRLSTVWDADLIVVLDRGEIVERGSHEELRARHGLYSRLVHSQRDTADAVCQ
jgi:ATP-binding cassette, subfamily B, bacterial